MVIQSDPGDTGVLLAERTPDEAVDDATPPGIVDRAARSERVAAFRACLASEVAFRRFYDQALPRVYGYLLSRCRGDTALAEDLTQTAFGEAVRHRASYDGRSDSLTWLIGIARHKLIDHFRAEEKGTVSTTGQEGASG